MVMRLRMHRRSYAVAWILTVLAPALACAPGKTVKEQAVSRTGPAIELSSRSWDFGTLKRGEKNAGEITAANVGTDTLSISLYPTCDCLEAWMDSDRLAPGEALTIRMTYLGDEIKDRLTKTLYVESNDEQNPRIAFAVTGKVIPGDGPHLKVTPDPLLFDPEDSHYPEASLTFRNIGNGKLEVMELRCFGCQSDHGASSLPLSLGAGTEVFIRIMKLEGWTGARWIEIESDDPVHPLKKVSILEL